MIGSLREGMYTCKMDILRQKAKEITILFRTCLWFRGHFRVGFVSTSLMLAR